MSFHAKDSKQERRTCLLGVPSQACTMVSSTFLYPPPPPPFLLNDVKEEKRWCNWQRRVRSFHHRVYRKREREPNPSRTLLFKTRRTWDYSSEENREGSGGILSRARVTDPMWGTGVEEAPVCTERPYGYSLLNT